MVERAFELIFLVFGAFFVLGGIIGAVSSKINVGVAFVCLSGCVLVFLSFFIHVLHIAIVCGLFLVLIASVGFLIWIYLYGSKDTATFAEDAVVVLGERLWEGEPSPELASRLESAYLYYQKNPDCIIVVTGGYGENGKSSESLIMERYLLKAGVPSEKIVREGCSKTTKENMINTKHILDKHFSSPYSIAVITSGYHIYRGKINAQSAGFKNITTFHSKTRWNVILPYGVREVLGILAYGIFNFG